MSLLYASLIVPNALQRIPYGSHIAPAGRFGWSAMWLWLVPLGIAASGLRSQAALGWGGRLIVLSGISYQGILALEWVPVPGRLFNGLFPPDVWQPSLFPPDVMLSLPKFGTNAGILYPPNVIWTLAAFALIAAGFLHGSKLRHLPVTATVLLACFVLPVDDTLERSRMVPRRYEAENTPARCTVYARGFASNGYVCRQDMDHRAAVAGPFISLEPGGYRVVAIIHQGGRRDPGRGSLQVVADRGITSIAYRRFRLVPSANWTPIAVEFHSDRALNDVEFRVLGFRGLVVDYIELRRLGG